jgi:uncharacterized protein YkwD
MPLNRFVWLCVCVVVLGSMTRGLMAADDHQGGTSASPAVDQGNGQTQEASATSGPKLFEVEKQIIDQTNAQRAKYGLPPLVIDTNLEKTARVHTVWMTNNHALQHSNQNVGENIAMGQRTTGEAVSDWMASPGHRANILNNSYKRSGVAAFKTPDGTIYWCQQFLP